MNDHSRAAGEGRQPSGMRKPRCSASGRDVTFRPLQASRPAERAGEGEEMSDLLNAPLSEVDPVISRAVDDEGRGQAQGLELIASGNFVSGAVPEALGPVFT